MRSEKKMKNTSIYFSTGVEKPVDNPLIFNFSQKRLLKDC